MKAKDHVRSVFDTLLTEIHELNEEIDLVPEIIAKQLNGSEKIEFRPLTKDEKEEFLDSLDAKGRQILADFAGTAKN